MARVLLPRRVRDEVLGDLEERYRRLPSDRPLRRRVRYWREALGCALRLRLEHARGNLRTATPLLNSLSRRPTPASPSQSSRMNNILQDVRYAIRAMMRAPGFALAGIVTLALAVGANTALFSVVNGVLIAPLPYSEPEELVSVWAALTARDVDRMPMSFPMLQELREADDVFESVTGIVSGFAALGGEGLEPERVPVGWVSWNLLGTLGVRPVLGRDFGASDAVPGGPAVQLVNQPVAAPAVALLGHGAWQTRFGGAAATIGQSLLVDSRPVEIVGILPEGFRLHLPASEGVPEEHDLLVVLRPDFDNAPLANVMLSVIARLHDEVPGEQATAVLRGVADRLTARSDVLATAGLELRTAPLDADVTAQARPALVALMGAVGFVLLIACANISTLLLVRATGRRQEIAVRSALGASRTRLVTQMTTESLVLGLLGGALGAGLGGLMLAPLMELRPADLPRSANVTLDAQVLLFSLVISMGAALVFGVLPAIQSTRSGMTEALKVRIATGDRFQRRARNGVVLAQVALSTVLLVGAGAMVRTFVDLARTDPGFDPAGVVKVVIDLPEARYPDRAERNTALLRLQERLGAISGVRSVSATVPVPLDGVVLWGRYGTEEALADPSRFRQANYRLILPEYVEAMGARLLAGRALDRGDFIDAAPNVMVDSLLADRLWPDTSAIGERLWVRTTAPEPMQVEVVGVVAPEYFLSLSAPGPEAIYFPASAIDLDLAQTWLVRGDSGDPLALAGEIRGAVREVDPLLPLAEMATMQSVVNDALGAVRGTLALVGLFSFISATMAAVGLYGVLAYSVRHRTTEMGVRMALGAAGSDLRTMVIAEGVRLALAGVALGLAGSYLLTRALDSVLTGVTPADPLTFAAAAALFLLVAASASWIPARRATRIDPLDALGRG